MAEQRSPQTDDSENFIAIALLLGLSFAGYWFFTNYFGDELRVVWRAIRVVETGVWWLFSWPLHLVGLSPSPAELSRQISWLIDPPGGNVTPEAVAILNKGYGNAFSKVVALYFAFKIFSVAKKSRIARRAFYDAEGNALEPILKLCAGVNPNLKPFLKENPCDFPVYYRPYEDNRYAQRITPWDFARMSIPPGLDTVDGDPYRDIGCIFDTEKPRGQRFSMRAAETVFQWQMGRRTQGKKTFSIMSDTEKKVYKHIVSKLFNGKKAAARIVARHAYIRTALMELYFHSSASTADMPWLKYEDRTLWYCLQDADVKVCSAECAGPWTHWQVERVNQCPIPIPAIDFATTWMANLCDIDDDELAGYLKEDEMVREDPDYWANQRTDAIKASKAKRARDKKASSGKLGARKATSALRKIFEPESTK